MRIILHIGFHKTGTSALQDFFSRNAPALLQNGVFYEPLGGKWQNHHALALMFRMGEDQAKGRAAVARMLKKAAANGAHTVLISSEVLVENRTDVAAFLKCFDQHEVEVVLYVRRPDEAVASAHDQIVRAVKHRSTRRVTDRPYAYNPRYAPLLQAWENAGATIKLAPYDKAQWPQGNIFLDFLAMIGITDASAFDLSVPKTNANIRLIPQLNEVLRLANFEPAAPKRHRQLVGALYNLQEKFSDLLRPAPAMKDEEAAKILKALAPHLDHLSAYYRPGFDDGFLRGKPAADKQNPEGEISESPAGTAT